MASSSSSPSPSSSPSIKRTVSSSSAQSSSPLSKTFSDASTQTLTSVLNNPHSNETTVWSFFSASSSSSHTPSPTEFLPINHSIAATSLSKPDFKTYLSSVSDSHRRFLEIQYHNRHGDDGNGDAGGGDALVACLREVPSLYFKEDFRLEDGATFKAACPFSSFSENLVLQEKLSQYLDVVELHLVREISLRSSSFFEAQRELEDLNGKIVEGCGRIKELKGMVRELDTDLVGSARKVQELSVVRSGLLGIQQKLKLVLNVNQAVSALKLLVASGDCAGALDITDVLQKLLDGDELSGLHCFRHLRDHVTTSIDSINSILSAEFMRVSIQDVGDMDVVILSKAKERASSLMNGTDAEVKLDEEETSNFRDQLLPLIIGLLKTAKLPLVLRIYRDTLTTDMKTAIKNAVAELLPALSQPMESDFSSGDRASEADGGHQSLANKLRSLSSDSFVLLLSAIFKIVKAHLMRAAEVKKAIEWILSNLDGHYAAESVAAAIAHGASAAETAQDGNSRDGTHLTYSSPQKNVSKVPSLQGKANETGSPSNISKNFRTDVLRENTEAVFAACDAAHGRWAKLLGVRALLHPKLRLQEFLSIYDLTQEFITATEKIGGRLGYSIRGTLQSQAKAFVDFQHESKMAKLKAVLDQETWVEVDVPDKFQSIVSTLFCSQSSANGSFNETQESIDGEVVNDGSVASDSTLSDVQEKAQQIDANETTLAKVAEAKSSPLAGENETNEGDRTSSPMQSHSSNMKGHLKPRSHTLMYRGEGYHMTNCGLILLKMLSEYIDVNNFLPALSSEVVHRVVEILKFFNTRTCQLVLGAGALQVSGLKNINSKHLTLASQVISFVHAIIPEIRGILFLKVPEARKALLLLEIDRVAQDYKIHRDEIHTKLVQIMRERLLYFLRGLPQTVESWNRSEDSNSQPSQLAQTITKQVGFLQRVLSKTLHEADVQAIFSQIAPIIHSQVSEAYSRQEISTPHAKERLRGDIEHLLGCIRSLPTGSSSDTPNWGQLDKFLAERIGDETSQ